MCLRVQRTQRGRSSRPNLPHSLQIHACLRHRGRTKYLVQSAEQEREREREREREKEENLKSLWSATRGVRSFAWGQKSIQRVFALLFESFFLWSYLLVFWCCAFSDNINNDQNTKEHYRNIEKPEQSRTASFEPNLGEMYWPVTSCWKRCGDWSVIWSCCFQFFFF